MSALVYSIIQLFAEASISSEQIIEARTLNSHNTAKVLFLYALANELVEHKIQEPVLIAALVLGEALAMM